MQINEHLSRFFEDRNNEISMRDYINFCLYSKNGFYNSENPFGKSGSFVTSPMISSLFGEIIALFLINLIQENALKSISIVEIGSGNGLLMLDIVRIFEKYRINAEFFSIEKAENNRKNLAKIFENKVKILEKIDDFNGNNPCFFITNELLDSYGVNQYIFKKDRWNMVKLRIEDGKIVQFADNNFDKSELEAYIERFYKNEKTPTVLEISRDQIDDFEHVCRIVNANSGGLIYFDYGYEKSPNTSTLQAILNHEKVNILQNPMQADITHLVNFSVFMQVFRKTVENYSALSCILQGEFLLQNGINELAEIYAKSSKNSDNIDKIRSSVRRLTSEMGDLFKVILGIKL
ncbi:SAM-dependent methyltransferase [Candidatus Deianiraea vastatrix]|uniref:SAM-dependent methyltransferase n=1 Tax=Candidatus Deianiraea vastatrix TaxID=2163644 RepID=A0A5B8XEI8_9RICK|nr:SAM-dependent methyltransferase [Candidatus Deianiraea vastatrix]QED23728.1 Putative SAM-dependent methyltransferase [Candidatus Deianiraea vastatrix]